MSDVTGSRHRGVGWEGLSGLTRFFLRPRSQQGRLELHIKAHGPDDSRVHLVYEFAFGSIVLRGRCSCQDCWYQPYLQTSEDGHACQSLDLSTGTRGWRHHGSDLWDWSPGTSLLTQSSLSRSMRLQLWACMDLKVFAVARLSILRYHPVKVSGSFIPLVQSSFSSSLLVCEGLFCLERRPSPWHRRQRWICRKYLDPFFMAAAQAGPEPVDAWSLLAGLGDIARIDGYCNAMSLCRFQERPVERQPVEEDFLKFWRDSAFAERPHLAIWVKLSRPVCVRISSMVSMKKDWKDLLKFVWPERAFEIYLSELDRGLIFMSCNLECGNSKLLKIKHLSKFFKRYFHLFKHFPALFYAVCEML